MKCSFCGGDLLTMFIFLMTVLTKSQWPSITVDVHGKFITVDSQDVHVETKSVKMLKI